MSEANLLPQYSPGYLLGKRIGVYDLDGCVVDSSARLRKYVDTAALARGDYTAYTHSFYEYGQTTEGDVPISRGVMLVQALAELYRVDALVALTSRGEVGRGPTESWLAAHMPWATGGELLMMHRERHFGKSELGGVGSWLDPRDKVRWGYDPDVLSEHSDGDVFFDTDRGLWTLPVKSKDELFSPSRYKKHAMERLCSWCDVAFAVDDHPEIIETYDGMGFDSFRVVWSSVDCLTPAGDPRSIGSAK
ncbi:MAG: hypothetical protein JSS66_06125 [Armatimonadetes bacterium]|nr:hypothetical protein [Armatimonadota bacterium]